MSRERYTRPRFTPEEDAMLAEAMAFARQQVAQRIDAVVGEIQAGRWSSFRPSDPREADSDSSSDSE
jgi:hypothetical protein